MDDSKTFSDFLSHVKSKDKVDWQQIRIQASIAAMKGLISNPDDFITNQSPSGIAKKSILFADALVKELKGE